MASKEVEVLDPATTVEKVKELVSGVALNRRHFMAALGAAGAVVGAEMVSSTPTLAQQPTPSGYAQVDVLNFLLNIKYLKATLYSYLTQGSDLPPATFASEGAGAVYNAPSAKVAFSGVYAQQLTDLFNEMYYDDLNQIVALRNLQGSVTANRQTVNLLGTGSTTTATAAFTQNLAIQYARMLEDVSVQAFAGAAPYLSGANLALATQILATDGFHAGALRLAAIQNGVPYLSTNFLTSTSTAGTGQSINTFTAGLLAGTTTLFTMPSTNPIVAGDLVSGPGLTQGAVVTAVNPAPIYLGSISGSTTVPTNTVTITSPTSIPAVAVGLTLTGTGIPANAVIASLAGNVATLAFVPAPQSLGVPGFSAATYSPLVAGTAVAGTAASPAVSAGITTTATGVTLTLGFAAILNKTATLSQVTGITGLLQGMPLSGTGISNLPISTVSGSTIVLTTASASSVNVTPTGVWASGSTTITSVSSTNGVIVGQAISATGIPSTATIKAVDYVNNIITSSVASTAASISTVGPTGFTTTGSSLIQYVSSVAGITAPQPISGTGIPANSYVSSVNSQSLTLTLQNGSSVSPVVPALATVTTALTSTTTPSGFLTSGSATILAAYPLQNVASGQPITGTGIPAGTIVTGIGTSALTITMSQNATLNTTPTTVATITGTVTATSPFILAPSSLAGIAVGQQVAGSNIPLGVVVLAINGTNTVTVTGSFASGATSITGVPSTAGLVTGMGITGAGIPAGATITAVGASGAFGGTLTLSAATTAASVPVAGETLVLTFVTPSTNVPANSIRMSAAASGTVATESIAFQTGQAFTTFKAGTAFTSTSTAETITIPTLSTVTFSTGTATLSVPATVSGVQTITTSTSDPLDVQPNDPGSIVFGGTTTSGSTTVSAVSNFPAALVAGLQVSGPGIPAGTTIATVASPTITLSAAATASGTAVVLAAYPATAAATALLGPSAVSNTSPSVYQGFFDTAGSATATSLTPVGFAFARTFSQVLQVLYGSTATSQYQGGFYPNGVSGSINVV